MVIVKFINESYKSPSLEARNPVSVIVAGNHTEAISICLLDCQSISLS